MWGTLIRLRTRNSISMEEYTRTNVFERYFFDFKLMPLSFLPRDPMKIRQIISLLTRKPKVSSKNTRFKNTIHVSSEEK